MASSQSGTLETDGLRLHYETVGEGTPVVLLHGGMLTVDLDFADLVPVLARDHRVVALEQQAHGRSTDTDREIRPDTLAGDVVALLDHLGVDRAHVVGHSMGATVAVELAIHHGGRVLGVVPISANVRPEGMHADLSSPEAMATSTRMPTPADFAAVRAAYDALSPTPGGFETLLAKMQGGRHFTRGWTDEELARIAAPVLWVIGDHDFTTVEHAALMLELVAGSTLAVLPGTTHMSITRRVDLLAPVVADFLARIGP